MRPVTMPAFPYGAVYFRKSNPPREDWQRDYATASADGMNIFRHWFLWSAIETAPGVYDWDDYDRQLDLAAQHGLRTVIAEMITAAPEWAYRVYAHARQESRDGRLLQSIMGASTVVGGFPGLCLDHADYRHAADRFLRALAARYRDHPGLGVYDIWNECGYSPDTCYCPATAEAFRVWLHARYGDLGALARAWHRYSLARWEDVLPPRYLGAYPDVLDWLEFRQDHAYEQMRWRAEVIRSVDAAHGITAHGVAGTVLSAASRGTDDWRAAREVSTYGFTWVACRKGDEPWKQFHAADLVRAASRGKPFWHAEAQGGPLWMQPQVIGRRREDGRIASPEDIRYWNLVSFMGGATGLLYPRWRPLLDGPLWGAFGAYGMDGGRTLRSEMASRIARWANAPEQADLWRSRPVRGEVGIVYTPETQRFCYAQQESTDLYTRAMWGAYRGFFDVNIQADWVHVDDIADYRILYLPYPIMLAEASARALQAWVMAGGTLISEGCPAYFGDRGHVGPVQPNYGMDVLFGAREAYVEFTPDLLVDLQAQVAGARVWGGILLQAYVPTTGTVAGTYADGRVAAVDNACGAGRTRLLGTSAGAGVMEHRDDTSVAFYAGALAYGGGAPHAQVSDARVIARVHDGAGGPYLWVANPEQTRVPVRIRLGKPWEALQPVRSLWGAPASASGGAIALIAPARDVTVIALG